MDLKQLDTFVRVAELGSFTRAASVLRVAQPALSRQVRALEVELRQPLFDRNGRGVTLTEAGKRLLAHGRGILQQVQRARQDLEEQRGAAAGLLSIGLPPSLSRSLTTALVEAFRARFPKATLSVVEGLSTYMLEWLMQGRIDCALVYNAQPAAAFDLQPVADEALFLVSARRGKALVGRPATLADVAAHDLVIPSRPHAIRMRVESALAEAALKPRVALEVESVPAILDLVVRHPLHAVLALNAIVGSARESELAARPIVAPGGARLATTIWMATSAQRPRGPLLEQALPLVRALVEAQVGGKAEAALRAGRSAAKPAKQPRQPKRTKPAKHRKAPSKRG
ncbi:MAG: LysR family transcriptional regulator [Betaproteobacteria bacterium]|jgi:LysR family nitrogen assimilation transcriptional regulator|nr:LysR family transcriptional regulator [Betaproteobacteria bacterium]MCC6249713.1 LysR family transcriptional regulator [Rubrivivax sp.]MCL4696513.1 LysR family transcriptional regulator [Burkholderiaceae bacterium]